MSSTKLVLEFADAEGKTINMEFNYADSSADTMDVKTLINTIIANGDIFVNVPVTAKSAKRVTITESQYNIS